MKFNWQKNLRLTLGFINFMHPFTGSEFTVLGYLSYFIILILLNMIMIMIKIMIMIRPQEVFIYG